jgi:hypothetical protein
MVIEAGRTDAMDVPKALGEEADGETDARSAWVGVS